jgi:hypothetical protein
MNILTEDDFQDLEKKNKKNKTPGNGACARKITTSRVMVSRGSKVSFLTREQYQSRKLSQFFNQIAGQRRAFLECRDVHQKSGYPTDGQVLSDFAGHISVKSSVVLAACLI